MKAEITAMVAKIEKFIYNYLSKEVKMMNFNNSRTKRIISSIIIIILVLAMVIPTFLYFVS